MANVDALGAEVEQRGRHFDRIGGYGDRGSAFVSEARGVEAEPAARLDVEAQIVQLQSRATRLQNQTLIAHDALRIVSDKGLE